MYSPGSDGYGAASDAASAKSAARSAADDVRQLRERMDQLTLACAAMWQLIREKTSLTEQDLAERMAIIDAKDGVADGKMTRVVDKCPKCSRPMSPKYKRCLYCGFQKPLETVFDQI